MATCAAGTISTTAARSWPEGSRARTGAAAHDPWPTRDRSVGVDWLWRRVNHGRGAGRTRRVVSLAPAAITEGGALTTGEAQGVAIACMPCPRLLPDSERSPGALAGCEGVAL